MKINRVRVFLGGLAGGVVWVVWNWIVNHFIIGTERWTAAQNAGLLLKTAHHRSYQVESIILLFLASAILAYLYAAARQTLGPGPVTALRIGVLVGFIAGFPLNFAQATWAPIDRMFPLGWTLGMWGGCVLATLVAGWLYKG